MALLLADGQLGASVATVLGTANGERCVGLFLVNVAEQDQEVFLYVTRSSTARLVVHGVLKKYEACHVNGLRLDPSAVLSGYASGAASVDYTVATSEGPFAVTFRDANGAPKTSQALEVTLPESDDLSAGEVKISGLLEECRELLAKIA